MHTSCCHRHSRKNRVTLSAKYTKEDVDYVYSCVPRIDAIQIEDLSIIPRIFKDFPHISTLFIVDNPVERGVVDLRPYPLKHLQIIGCNRIFLVDVDYLEIIVIKSRWIGRGPIINPDGERVRLPENVTLSVGYGEAHRFDYSRTKYLKLYGAHGFILTQEMFPSLVYLQIDGGDVICEVLSLRILETRGEREWYGCSVTGLKHLDELILGDGTQLDLPGCISERIRVRGETTLGCVYTLDESVRYHITYPERFSEDVFVERSISFAAGKQLELHSGDLLTKTTLKEQMSESGSVRLTNTEGKVLSRITVEQCKYLRNVYGMVEEFGEELSLEASRLLDDTEGVEELILLWDWVKYYPRRDDCPPGKRLPPIEVEKKVKMLGKDRLPHLIKVAERLLFSAFLEDFFLEKEVSSWL